MTRLLPAVLLASAALVACDRSPDVMDPAAAPAEGSATEAEAAGASAAADEAAGDEAAADEAAADEAAHPTDDGAPAADEAAAGAPWTTVAADALTDAQVAQRAVGNAQRDALMRELVGALTAEIQANGHGAAVALCNEAAPAIRARINAHPQVTVGRTAQRLRNPDNAPPAWAADLVAAGEPGPHLRVGPDGQLAELSPIVMPAMCTSCHGAEEQIAVGVADALAALYPADQATGFAEGDLRGWFWTVTEAGAMP